MASDATIRFDISLDLGKIKTAIDDASRKVNSEFNKAFSSSASKCQKSCDEMAGAFKKVDAATDETRQKINNILNDNEKSIKSKASSIAWIYRKQGMNQSDAMKKAWSEIERTTGTSSEKVETDIRGIGKQAAHTSKSIGENLIPTLKKIGIAMIAAFSVKKVVDFGKQCLELGSDLAEVQNVVDVTFPRMSKQIDSFAKNAASQFGLSETMAKKFTGTFGAMAKAFGFNEQAAHEMSTTLTGLAGDVASFYNISQDESYTKLKSVFTGETESLKDLGIVMTQTALDSYALTNGFGKTTAKMSEMEKVALRYKFVQSQLTTAAGDFSRTSDGWANQIRILQLQFDSLKATIGQGLINVLSPVVKVINMIIGKLMSLANAFKAFTELITGKKGTGGGVSEATASGMEAVAGAADNASGAVNGVGSAAEKAGKKAKESLSGIDKLNVLSSSASGAGGGGGSGSGGYAADEFDMGALDTSQVEEAQNKYQALIDRARELSSLFKGGFNIAFGDTSVLDSIKASIQGITESLKDIFLDTSVMESAKEFINRLALAMGKNVGAMASIGATLADNLLGGIDKFLEQNKERIKEYIIAMFDIGSRIADIIGNFSTALAEIFTAFRSDSAKQIVADVIGIFSEVFMGVTELVGTWKTDMLDMITAPFIENADAIKEALENTFSAVEPIFSSIKDLVSETFEKIKTTYDEHVAPMLMSFKEGFTEIAAKLLEIYNTYFIPVIQNLAAKFVEFKDQYLSPWIDKFLEFAGKVADAITVLWENVLKPFILWFIDNVAPIIAKHIQTVIDVFFLVAKSVAIVVSAVLDSLGGVIDFITAAFAGDWEQAWAAITDHLGGAWEVMKSLVDLAMNFISDHIGIKLSDIKQIWDSTWENNKFLKFAGKVADAITVLWENVLKPFILWFIDNVAPIIAKHIQTVIDVFFLVAKSVAIVVSAVLDSLGGVIDFITAVFTGNWEQAWTAVTEHLDGAWETMKSLVDLAMNFISDHIGIKLSDIKQTWDSTWENIGEYLNNIWTKICDRVNKAVENVHQQITDKLEQVKSKWEENWSSVRDVTVTIFEGIWNSIKGVINSILGGVEKMANGVVKAINKVGETLNNFQIDLPEAVAEKIGFDSLGFDIPQIREVSIPRLAQGGFVKANTPQLAMIGDNRHYGEVVAPENKLQDLLNKAVASGGNDVVTTEMLLLLREMKALLKIISEKNPQTALTSREIFEAVKKENANYKGLHGGPAFI